MAIADLGADRLAHAAEEIAALSPGGANDVMALETDVSRVDDVRRLEAAVRERFGGTDVLMNNAGIQPGSDMFGPAENWQRVIAVNLWGVIHGTRCSCRRCSNAAGRGSSSTPAPSRGSPRRPATRPTTSPRPA